MSAVRLGPFILLEKVAQNGSSQTWRGLHPGRSLPVWVSVDNDPSPWESRQRVLFRRMMRGIHRLSHPSIRRAFAHGVLDPNIADQLDDPSLSNRPFWVWEAPPNASQPGLNREASWPQFQRQILSLLDAFAHAHARKILHLGDIGEHLRHHGEQIFIHGYGFPSARLLGGRSISQECAPELKPYQPHQVGPWTDLYHLGLLIRHFIEGTIETPQPLNGNELGDGAAFHVSVDFEDWLDGLLAAEPSKRYQSASEAAWALQRFCGNTFEPWSGIALNFSGSAGRRRPAIPMDWQQPEHYLEAIRGIAPDILRAEMRRIPIVGFVEERNALWSSLRTVCEEGVPHCVWLDSETGLGKSRLCDWLCERAEELGVARTTSLDIRPNAVPGVALRDLLIQLLRVGGVPQNRYPEAVRNWVQVNGGEDGELEAAILEMLSRELGIDSSGLGAVSLESLAARRRVIMRVIGRIASDRPVILVLGDVHLSSDFVGLVPLIRQTPRPILLVVTSNSEELSEHPNQYLRLRRWLSNDVLQLGRLSDSDHVAFVERLLGLEGLLANRVAKATRGLPLFAIELVDYWLEREWLAQTTTGLVLILETDIPKSLPDLWSLRTREYCDSLDPAALQMLEVAAALGRSVDEDEWQEVCDDPKGVYRVQLRDVSGGVVFSPGAARVRFELVNALLQRRLATETESGWRFAHQEVWNTVRQGAVEAGRWRVAHLSCAKLLRRKKEKEEFGATERYALHLWFGGESLASFKPMLEAVEERTYSSGPRMALGLLDRCERSMIKLGLKASDRRWGDVWLSRARLSLLVGDHQGAEDWAVRARDVGLREEWTEIVWIAQFYCAQVKIKRGQLEEAERELTIVRGSIPEGRDPATTARVIFGLASIARHQHQFDRAFELYGESCRFFAFAGRSDGEASCWRDMAAMEISLGNPVKAEQLYRKAYLQYEKLGKWHEMANCINGFAESARLQDDDSRAEQEYLRAIDLFESVGAGQVIVPRLNLAMLNLKKGNYKAAQTALKNCLRVVADEDRRLLVGCVYAALMMSSAGLRDWLAFDSYVGAAEGELKEHGFAERDCAWAAERAASLLSGAGQPERSRRAAKFALSQYRALEDAPGVKRIAGYLQASGV